MPRLAQGSDVADKSEAVVVPRAAAVCDGLGRVFEAGVLGQRASEEGRDATACEKRGEGGRKKAKKGVKGEEESEKKREGGRRKAKK